MFRSFDFQMKPTEFRAVTEKVDKKTVYASNDSNYTKLVLNGD
jgi:hypothetical protein